MQEELVIKSKKNKKIKNKWRYRKNLRKLMKLME